ncbi:hypothetical protein RRU94_22275 [Domibacillus sp. DTU_2020_1001157_1_SI_ALB_TIR_016]|nr:hypothetical protein [Domibacillus sp. DTU_2020_1001157_1_SI_ALB_TIR_016]WNS80212.1 hypothetical protein RRU94_22275 [Domibacillus sp. DTU_2020_1001157_1_SI_ALB_TIR_016]
MDDRAVHMNGMDRRRPGSSAFHGAGAKPGLRLTDLPVSAAR